MRYFHIISVGNSLISNYQRKGTQEEAIKLAKPHDNLWDDLSKDVKFQEELFNFLRSDPEGNSAEVNSFMGYLKKKKISPEDCVVYLIGTKTSSNELARKVIERFLETLGVKVLSHKQVSGYFRERKLEFDSPGEEFVKGLSELTDRLLEVALRKKKEGYIVVFNPTGGMKPHVIVCAFVGFMTMSEVYYIHEEFDRRDVVVIPPLFYLPRGGEVECLSELKRYSVLSGREFEKFVERHGEGVISRLERYGLVEIEHDEDSGKAFRVRITGRGKAIFDILSGGENAHS